MIRIVLFSFGLWVGVCDVGAADFPPPSNRISFDVSASEEVASDLLVVRLFSQHQARQQAQAANRVNEEMTWALAEAGKVSSVRAQTLDYRTTPVYEERKIRAWQTRQSMRLESPDRDALTSLLGMLQERLGIESVAYEISPVLRAGASERLTDAAIERFRARAAKITAAFSRQSYTLVQVNIGTQGGQRQPVAYRGRALAMQAEVADPSIDAGQQTLTVNINGTIELSLQ
jgi:predicted secreted protein